MYPLVTHAAVMNLHRQLHLLTGARNTVLFTAKCVHLANTAIVHVLGVVS